MFILKSWNKKCDLYQHKYSNFSYINKKHIPLFFKTQFASLFVVENLCYRNKFSSFSKNVPQMSYVNPKLNPDMVLRLLHQNHLDEALKLAVLEKLSEAQ